MKTCYDCIHCDVCSDAGDSGFSSLKEDASKCKHFKNKANFAEVIRCGNCIHKQELNKWEKEIYVDGCVACERINPNGERDVMCSTDFCSYGERK